MSLSQLPSSFDLVIIGGGITGAGILREASRMGLRVLLVEQRDFAWGTSSRSSKLVHGGLRYLKEGQFRLTKIAVEERERLLKEAPGLVEPLEFFLPVYEGQHPGRRTLKIGLALYDIMARERQHRFYDADQFYRQAPYILRRGLLGGFCYLDAQVDDCRLVLRLIMESVGAGARALNYTRVTQILRDDGGNVTGVAIVDTESGQTRTIASPAVINATGCWAEKLHPSPDPHRHLRPLRGSHLVLPARVLPVDKAFSFIHPTDNRAVFVIPWEGAVLAGTTDLDHSQDLDAEPVATAAEVTYLMKGLQTFFPALNISRNECLSVFAGVRPVLSEGNREPSEESREHVVWVDRGLVTITGGKLTTFRRLAADTLRAGRPFLPPDTAVDRHAPVFSPLPDKPQGGHGLSGQLWQRLCGRYGQAAESLVAGAAAEDLAIIPGTRTLWAELPHAAANESIRHLDDLLLRRVRIGLLTPAGGKAHLKRIRKLCRPALSWSRRRWRQEIKAYLDLWQRAYAPPDQRNSLKDAGKSGFAPMPGAAFRYLRHRFSRPARPTGPDTPSQARANEHPGSHTGH